MECMRTSSNYRGHPGWPLGPHKFCCSEKVNATCSSVPPNMNAFQPKLIFELVDWFCCQRVYNCYNIAVNVDRWSDPNDRSPLFNRKNNHQHNHESLKSALASDIWFFSTNKMNWMDIWFWLNISFSLMTPLWEKNQVSKAITSCSQTMSLDTLIT